MEARGLCRVNGVAKWCLDSLIERLRTGARQGRWNWWYPGILWNGEVIIAGVFSVFLLVRHFKLFLL